MTDGACAEMPKYKCHKIVHALKIKGVERAAGDRPAGDDETDGGLIITPEETPYTPFRVERDYARKHDPQPGGYYVVYEDGYKSFSPAEAFEAGYTRTGETP